MLLFTCLCYLFTTLYSYSAVSSVRLGLFHYLFLYIVFKAHTWQSTDHRLFRKPPFYCMFVLRLTMLRLVRMYRSVSCLWTCWTSGPTTTSSSKCVISGIRADRRSRPPSVNKENTQYKHTPLSCLCVFCVFTVKQVL